MSKSKPNDDAGLAARRKAAIARGIRPPADKPADKPNRKPDHPEQPAPGSIPPLPPADLAKIVADVDELAALTDACDTSDDDLRAAAAEVMSSLNGAFGDFFRRVERPPVRHRVGKVWREFHGGWNFEPRELSRADVLLRRRLRAAWKLADQLSTHRGEIPPDRADKLRAAGKAIADAAAAATGTTVPVVPTETDYGPGHWLMPMTTKDMAVRLGNIGEKKARSILESHGLKMVNGNRQLWTVRLDTMPLNWALKLDPSFKTPTH